MKSAWAIIKDTFNEFSEDRALRLAAATAYYAIFSIGPLLVLIVGVAGLAFGEENVRQEVIRQVQSLVGDNSAKLIGSMMSPQRKGGSLMATIIGGGALLFGASGVFGQLQDSLNTIWGVTPRPGQSFWAFVRNRFFSLATVLGIGFLLIVSMALSAFVNAFAHQIGTLTLLPGWVVPVIDALVSFAIISFLFGLIFKVLPDVKITWRYVWIGAVGTALLFTAGKFLLGFYLSHEVSASAYGTGSAFVIILLYIYYSSVIVYIGAEFTRAYARHSGSEIQPSRYAVRVTDHERAEQGMARKHQVEHAVQAAHQTPQQTVAGPGHKIQTVPASQPRLRTPTRSPLAQIRGKPYAFLTIALWIGLTTGLMWRTKEVRHSR